LHAEHTSAAQRRVVVPLKPDGVERNIRSKGKGSCTPAGEAGLVTLSRAERPNVDRWMVWAGRCRRTFGSPVMARLRELAERRWLVCGGR
jgi:hypothetical protein